MYISNNTMSNTIHVNEIRSEVKCCINFDEL